MNATLTVKPKKVREPAAPKPKFNTRPPGEILAELKGQPANGKPRPFFPLFYKTAILDKFLLPDHRWVLMDLGSDPELAVKQLTNRLTGEDLDFGDFNVTGHTDGMHAYKEGDDVGTWPYSQLYEDLVAFGTTEQLRLAGIKQPHKGVVPKLAKPNEHGVVESGCETVRIPLPATSKCSAEISLAKLSDGWRFGYSFQHSQGGQSGGPNVKDTAYPSRARALIVAAVNARDYFEVAHKRSSAAEAARCRKAGDAVQAFIDKLPSDDPPAKVDSRRDPPGHSPPPRVPPEVLNPPARELAKTVATALMIDLAQLQRHPENRQPAQKDVDERAASLAADGQLEDVEVRQVADGKYQIISGETRFLAAKQLKWTQIRCRVVECDDAEASMRVGLHNGQRTNLNPIQKAQRIQYLCERHGKTREEAARAVGLEAGSAASNLLRLLKLSKKWQDRIASGELPETFARVIAAYAHLPKLMEQLEDDWDDDYNRGESFGSRDDLERTIQNSLDDCTRPVDDRERYYYSHDHSSEIESGSYKCLLTKEELAKHHDALCITKLLRKEKVNGKWKSTEIEVAANVDLYDKLQIAHIKAEQQSKAKGKAKAAGKSADAGESKSKPKTAAEVRAAKEKWAGELGRAIDDWVETVMRREIAAAIRSFKPTAKADIRILKLVLGFVCDHAVSHDEAADQLVKVLKAKDRLADPHENVSRAFAEKAKSVLDCKGCQIAAWQKSAGELCAWLIGGDAEQKRPTEFDDDTLQALFAEWGCSLEIAWEKLWKAKDPLCEEFLQLHRKDELSALAWEMQGMKFGDNSSKDGMIAGLLNAHSPPLLPKSLQPVKGKRGAK